jgi:WhiB family redox-sensing transcriptional regulator
MDNLDWMREGNCTSNGEGAFVSWFFPEVGGSGLPAKAICRGCQVSNQCLDYALRHRIREGIWGGTSERERRKILRDRGGVHVVRRSTQDVGQAAQAS